MTQESFLKPTRKKILFTFLVGGVVFLLIWLLTAWNEWSVASILIFPFGQLPLLIFNKITASLFIPRECFVFCLPTIPQILAVIAFDLVCFYVIACTLLTLFTRR